MKNPFQKFIQKDIFRRKMINAKKEKAEIKNKVADVARRFKIKPEQVVNILEKEIAEEAQFLPPKIRKEFKL